MRKQELIDAAEASGLSRTPIMYAFSKLWLLVEEIKLLGQAGWVCVKWVTSFTG